MKAGDEVRHVQRVRLCWFGGLGRHELANIKPRSLRLPCVQRLFADRIAPLGMEEIVDEKLGLVEGLTTNVLPFRQNPVRTFPLQTQSYPGTRSIQCAEGYSADSSTSAESSSLVVYCAKTGLFAICKLCQPVQRKRCHQ